MTTSETSSVPRAKILVVDDDETLARSYARMLAGDGYEVEVRFDAVRL